MTNLTEVEREKGVLNLFVFHVHFQRNLSRLVVYPHFGAFFTEHVRRAGKSRGGFLKVERIDRECSVIVNNLTVEGRCHVLRSVCLHSFDL